MSDRVSTPSVKSDVTNDILDPRAFIGVIVEYRKFVISSVLGAAFLSVLYALSLSDIYRSSALLVPNSQDDNASLSGLANQFGGLANLAGFSMTASGDVPKSELAIHILQSRNFTELFISRHDILPELLAAKTWDKNSRVLTLDSELYDESKNEWVREETSSRPRIPTRAESFEAFQNAVSISQDLQTQLVSVSAEHISPDVAKKWVTLLVDEINEYMRIRDITHAKRAITYLRQQADSNQLADLDQTFFELVQNQMQTMMLAEVREEYVFVTVDPAVSPEIKHSPFRSRICIAGTLFGLLFALVVSFIRKFLKASPIGF